ncbi:carbohydrate kinase family protein [Pseudactinotalea suaedae]|uniref:carbohydrate kinase family protein n=1 Tax=Pseudactinotalea suaedae TaxID=1524924 RepID=UPI0012E1DC54|nr:carbohydrate kinase [Pseudactinotalea suaedae]
MSHALVIGEALVDIVHDASGTTAEHPGGSPANVALGLARLGRDTQLATWLGRDPRGHTVLDHLRASKVHVVPGSDGAARTSTAAATLDAEGAATYTFDLLWNVPEVHLDTGLTVLHVGSIGATLRPGADAVSEIALAAREYATISYDVNARPSIMGEPAEAEALIERVAARSDVIKVSDEDFRWLYSHLDPFDAAREWAQQGPAIVVVTGGSAGSTAFTSSGLEVTVAAPSVTVVDTVGAGDSYMSGLIDALWTADLLGAARREKLHSISEQELRTAMAWAGRVAAITVARPGADPPTRRELEPRS